jgi:hypothetical protein
MGLGQWVRQAAARYVEYMTASALDQHRHELNGFPEVWPEPRPPRPDPPEAPPERFPEV